MKTMCECANQRKKGNHQHIVMKKRCICWFEPVRVRTRSCCECHIEGMSLQLIDNENLNLPAGCPIVFDQIIFKNSNDMCCHEDNGLIEIHRKGSYLVDWDVAIEGVSHCQFARFGIEVDGQVVASSCLPTRSGQLSGKAIICANTLPTTVRLINDTDHEIHLSCHSPIANLRITGIK